MKLLQITEDEIPELGEHFEEVEHVDVESIAPEVVDGESDVKFKGKSVASYDAVFANIPTKNALFGRVALEIMEEEGIKTNYPSTGFFIMSKKNYLYHVLHEKDISATRTAVIASEKAARNIERELKGPLIARKFDDEVETERAKLETVDEIQDFADGIGRGNQFVLFQEFSTGDKYRCLVAGDQCISLADNSDGWDFSKENLQYHSISQEMREKVLETSRAIGTPIAEVLIRDGKVEDVNPNPDLELYTNISGKDAYDCAAQALKEVEI